MRIIIDEAIPFVHGLLEPYAQVDYLPAAAITPAACKDATALLVRTRTHCNAQLLEGSAVRLIATATIGMDHIDLPYCAQHGITVANAPASNAWGVVQWVVSALAQINQSADFMLSERTVGVVGCGAVGERVATLLELFGISVLRCDPFLEKEDPFRYVALSRIARECAVVTIHTPLTFDGPHPTHHLLDRAFFHSLKHRAYILHAARGGVVDDAELYLALQYKHIAGYYLDVYEEENSEEMDYALLEAAKLATPHIAGYSVEGKYAASRAVITALAQFLGVEIAFPPLEADGANPPLLPGFSLWELARTYDIARDSRALKAAPQQLERLRSEYAYRHDYRYYHFANPALEALVRGEKAK